ncbi:hypothetical protein AWB85_08615 [Mycobacteroides immunogenum]|uniref:Short-chain dehydrogenase n=1 Tax=Mycobacteroides immunogenum TaxID=83262 RepID=A0A179V9V5_9MYCO|nr:SDR family oxidoreductase [Mycobacteroides immunogenum]OAT67932.1 hypothetical protein AWB85_08615 [Mycobacteroides immunogenum]
MTRKVDADRKVVLITGTTSGFGKLTAERVAADGHLVYGTRLPNENVTSPGPGKLLELDVRDEDLTRSCVDQVIGEAGRLDVLINNAGMGIFGATEDIGIDAAENQFNVNYFGTLRMIRAALPHMRKAGTGTIINFGSFAARIALPFQSHYSASKAAVENMTEALRLEIQGTGVEATVVSPGDFHTGFSAARTVIAGPDSDFYQAKRNACFDAVNKSELNGLDPAMLGELIATIVSSRKIKPRYSIGTFEQRVATHLKGLLPDGVLEPLVRRTFDI